jgi:hypothetical protein
MPLYLPANLAALARLAPKENPRYRMDCLRVLDPADGTYRVDVTDGRRLAIVRGPVQSPAGYPAADEHPNGLSECLVPKDLWVQAMKAAQERPVALAMNEDGGLLACWNGLQIPVPHITERFPPCDSVLPKHPARCQMVFDPKLMAGLCQVAADLGMERVTLLFFADDRAAGVIGHNSDGQFFDGLIMPLS